MKISTYNSFTLIVLSWKDDSLVFVKYGENSHKRNITDCYTCSHSKFKKSIADLKCSINLNDNIPYYLHEMSSKDSFLLMSECSLKYKLPRCMSFSREFKMSLYLVSLFKKSITEDLISSFNRLYEKGFI